MSQELTGRVINIIAVLQKTPVETVNPESTFEELGLNSIDKVNLLFTIEDEFGITVPDDEAREVQSVREIVSKLEGWLAADRESTPNDAAAQGLG